MNSLNARRALAAIALSVLTACGGAMPVASPVASGSATVTASKRSIGNTAIPLPCRIQPAGGRIMRSVCGTRMKALRRR